MADHTPRVFTSGPFRSFLLLVPATAMALYGMTLSRAHTWDAIAYTARAHGDVLLSERYLSTSLFHPHHLLFAPMAQGFLWIWNRLPLHSSDPFLPVQIMVLILSGAGALLFSVIVLRRTGDGWTAMLCAGFFVTTHAVWRYSTEVEVMLPALFFALLALHTLEKNLNSPVWSARGLALVSIMASAGALVHQIGILFCIALVYYLWSSERRKQAITLGAGIAAIVGGVYLMVAVAARATRSPDAVLDWMFHARSRAVTGTVSPVEQLAAGVKGAFHAVLSPFGPTDLRSAGPGLVEVFLFAASIGSALVMVAVAVATAHSLAKRRRWKDPFARFCLVWLTAGAVFALWFEPDNIEYWVYCVPPALLLGVSGISLPLHLDRRVRRGLALALLVLLAVVNLHTSIAPAADTSNARYQTFVRAVRETMRTGDLILAAPSGTSVLTGAEPVAVPFLTGIDLVVVDHRVSGVMDRVRSVWRQGGQVYVLEEVLSGQTSTLFDGFETEPVNLLQPWRVSRLRASVTNGR